MSTSQAARPLAVAEPAVVTDWISAHAVPIPPAGGHREPAGGDRRAAGFERLLELAAGAQIVGIGGSTYGAHEQFELTFRIIALLVDQLGFRTVATEDDWDVALPIDEYLRTGTGDLHALVDTCGAPWQVAEIYDALTWLRQWNVDHPGDQVRFIGVGVINTLPPIYTAITEYVQRVAPAAAAELEQLFAVIRPVRPDHVPWFIMQVEDKERYCEYARNTLALLADLPVTDGSGNAEHELMLQHARQIVAFYEHYTFHLVDDGYRDQLMADNLSWWQRHTGHRIAYWSTTAHSACAPDLFIAVPPRGVLQFAATGSHLRQAYGTGYLSVALTYNSGTVNSCWAFPPFTRRPVETAAQPQSFSEYPLARVAGTPFAVDLRHAATDAAPPSVHQWLHGPAHTRIIGSIYDPSLAADEFYMTGGTLAEWFDLLIHQDTVTPTRDPRPS